MFKKIEETIFCRKGLFPVQKTQNKEEEKYVRGGRPGKQKNLQQIQ